MRKLFQSHPKLVKNVLFVVIVISIMAMGITIKSNLATAVDTKEMSSATE